MFCGGRGKAKFEIAQFGGGIRLRFGHEPCLLKCAKNDGRWKGSGGGSVGLRGRERGCGRGEWERRGERKRSGKGSVVEGERGEW